VRDRVRVDPNSPNAPEPTESATESATEGAEARTGDFELVPGRHLGFPFTYQVASCNPYQPPCFDASPQDHTQPHERRPPPLLGAHVLFVRQRINEYNASNCNSNDGQSAGCDLAVRRQLASRDYPFSGSPTCREDCLPSENDRADTFTFLGVAPTEGGDLVDAG
jgi:hypothetical protein